LNKKVKSPDRWASQQINNAKSSSQDWLNGINNPSRDPIQAAIAAEPKYVEAMKKVISEGRHAKGLQGKSLSDITGPANKLGASVFEQGIAAREDKIRSVVQKLQPELQAVSDKVQAMAETTEQDRERRMIENLRAMRQVGNKLRG
jgi:hypothetical protein